jgi:SAM-dependent methyltransferase
VKPFWSPQSALIVPDPPSLATPALLRLLLRAGGPIELLYAGDRMWPAVRHGQRVVVEALGKMGAAGFPDGGLLAHAAVVASPSGYPDLFRAEILDDGRIRLRGDSDPGEAVDVSREILIARASLPCCRMSPTRRALRRIALDLREAVTGREDSDADPAGSVRLKYEIQAPFYAGVSGPEMTGELAAWCREQIPPASRVLVAGCGTGRECFALARLGFTVTGVDFSPAMIEMAKREAGRRDLAVEFRLADLLSYEQPVGSLGGVYFTYDVYSFVANRADRIALLRRMARWLGPGGSVFLSARRAGRLYDVVILTLQRLVRAGRREARWGQSHTRWIAPDGSLHRSFVQFFTTSAVRREAEAAGLRMGDWRGNHCLLVRNAEERQGADDVPGSSSMV